MTVFADSSALVKLYADEDGAELVRAVELFVVSAVARVEVAAALWRKARTRALPSSDAALLADELADDWAAGERFVPVAVGEPVLALAVTVVARHGLRAYDGIQLASALAARTVDPGIDTVACFDHELADAAVREGFRLLE